MSDRKVLVTGGCGFIGSHVVDQFIAGGYQVVVVDNLSSGRRGNLNKAARLYELDIRSPDLEEVFQAENPQIVSHHAGQVDVRRSLVDPILDAEVNILGSLRVIEMAKKYRVKRLIYSSTGGAVYGEPEYLPCDEDHPIQPICQYGASKHAVEHYLHMYELLYGLDYTVLRYPNVYGPRQDPNGEAGVIAIFTGKMLQGQQVKINGDGEQGRDFVFVGDCARANLLAVVAGQNGIFNLASGTATTINQVAAHLKRITGYAGKPVHGPPIEGETRMIYLDAQKAGRLLGWEQQVPMEQGLAQTVDYFRTFEMANSSADRSTRLK
jgi:UDP-glucose 4-epimerase